MIRTACPLDCYDACAMVCDPDRPDKPVALSGHPVGNGSLCALMTKHIHKASRIDAPMIDGNEVSMDEALDRVADILKASDSSLLWRGSGNLGVMQSVTDLLMEKTGGTLTFGSLCDAAGAFGIKEGRGVIKQLPPEQIARAETVVVWGRNVPVTNSHLMRFIKGKRVIVIDPVRTSLAREADLHLQIRPRTDFYLAILLARFIIMEDSQNDEWLEKFAPDYEEFYDFTRSFRIKSILEHIGASLDDMGDMLRHMIGRRVVFIVGTGVQKYTIGHYVTWAIDSLAAILGLFGREGCGVSYLGNSRQGFSDPFRVETPRVSMVETPFEKFDCVIVQGGNPAESMPNSDRVVRSLSRVKDLIYFGLYENATSRLANIVIPARSFMEKDDLRLSYGHSYVERMNRVYDGQRGISEYMFVSGIFDRLGMDPLPSEKEIIESWVRQCHEKDGHLLSPDHEDLPYSDGFGEEGGEEFVFIDDFEDYVEDSSRFRKLRPPREESTDLYRLITPKSPRSLNTQFFSGESFVRLHPSSGFVDGEIVTIYSDYGESSFVVRIDEDLREDIVSIYAGTPGVNALTPSMSSECGDNACFQDVEVRIRKE